MPEQFDIVVIGGGTAGLVTASGCVRLGRRVALIEREALGGDCLWTGCVPTKALVASAKFAHQAANAQALGFTNLSLNVSPRMIMESMRSARAIIEPHDAPEKFQQLGIEVIKGEATFVSANTVSVGGRTLTAKDVVIATGSRTSVPPVPGLESSGYIDHASFLEQNEFPRSLIVLGGGYIGIEFAQIFRRFGLEVTVIEAADTMTPKEDHEIIAAVRELLHGEGISIQTSTKAIAVRLESGKKIVTVEHDGQQGELVADEIFVAAGRRGNVEQLNLETIGVVTDRSFVKVDEYLQTSTPHVWAVGDIHGGLQFTHVAAYEAVKLVRNLLFPGKSAVDYSNIPWALYTDPEIAHLGLTEREAVAKYGRDKVRIYRVDMHDVDRAVVDRTSTGFIKVICNPRGQILGAHAMCTNASTLIQPFVLARGRKLPIGAMAAAVSPYPSFGDAVGKVATQYYQALGASWLGSIAKKVVSWSQ